MKQPTKPELTDEQRAVFAGYVEFFKTGTGQDLINRLKATEARYMMEGMKASSLEQKGLAFERMHATYLIRTMLDDLSKPLVVTKVA